MTQGFLVSSFLKNTGVAFFLKAAGALLALGLNVWLGRLLGAEGFGILGVATSVAAFAGLFCVLGFHNSALRFIAQYVENRQQNLLRGFVQGTIGLATLISLGVSLLVWITASLLPGSPMSKSLLLAAMLVAFYALTPMLSKVIRGFGDVAGSLWPEQLLFPTVTLGLMLLFTPECFWDIVVLVVIGRYAALIASAALSWRQVRSSRAFEYPAEYDWKAWRAAALPLLLAALVQALFEKADTIMIGGIASLEDAGLYTAASKLSLLLSFVLGVVETAVAPMLSSAFHANRKADFRRLFMMSMLVSGSVGFVLLLAVWWQAAQLLEYFGAGFVQAEQMLMVLAIGQFINALSGPVAFALMVTGREKVYGNIMLVGGVTNIALNTILIPAWGGFGAAVATAVTLGGVNMLMFFKVRRLFLVLKQ